MAPVARLEAVAVSTVPQLGSASMLLSIRLLVHDFALYAGKRIPLAGLLVLLGAVSEGVGLVLLIPFFKVIIDSGASDSWVDRIMTSIFSFFSAESRTAQLTLLLAIFAILMIARSGIITARELTLAKLRIGFVEQIRLRITHLLAAASWDTVARLRHSRVVHLMSMDIEQVTGAIYLLMRDVVAIVMLIGQLTLAFLLAPYLAGLAVAALLLGAMTVVPLMKRARAIGHIVTNANLTLIDDVSQYLGGLKLAISQNLQESFTREFASVLALVRSQQIRYVLQQAGTTLAGTMVSGLVGAVVVVLGILVFDTDPAILITLLLILSRTSAPAMQLHGDAQQFAHAVAAYEKIRSLEDELAAATAAIGPRQGASKLTNKAGIVFRNVTYSHTPLETTPGAVAGVHALNLSIDPRSVLGVTGPSGAGKTTFADLLVGLYPPQSGEILIDGVALDRETCTEWRNCVSYVPQDPFLFHDTIRRNLLWARPDAEEDMLWDVLRIAGADQLVCRAPFGLDTIVGERGTLLSGGERQRINIARGLLRGPKLLVLDEATSAIDLEGEQMLLNRIVCANPGFSVIMIAHRLETLRYCERIIVLEAGHLVSDGPSASVLPHLQKSYQSTPVNFACMHLGQLASSGIGNLAS
jgi:ATP-binding cassette subfamily C protein